MYCQACIRYGCDGGYICGMGVRGDGVRLRGVWDIGVIWSMRLERVG